MRWRDWIVLAVIAAAGWSIAGLVALTLLSRVDWLHRPKRHVRQRQNWRGWPSAWRAIARFTWRAPSASRW